jgi:ADP-ribose pyrophosphatase YjhB (NUDIX family)
LGQWNGFGGKVEKGIESIAESAARELQEEAFLNAPLYPIGFIQWVVESAPSNSSNEPTYRDIMIVYKAHSLQPVPTILSSQSVQQRSNVTPLHNINNSNNNNNSTQRMTGFLASDEMAPAWWDIDNLPWTDMRINHKVWYPFMLADRPYRGVYWYETRTSVEPGAKNAQRETVKEIWVEDLSKRRVQFGDRSLSKNMSDGVEKEGKALETYARQLNLVGACYLSESNAGHAVIENEPDLSEPKVNRGLGGTWLRDAIAQVEKGW